MVARCWLPLDEHGAWYRYHPLFAELLRAELRAQLGGELEELHRRAAEWLAAHGDRTAALRHVAIGRVWDLGTQLVIDHWVDFMINGEMAALRPVLEAMPRERVDACPELSLAFGAAMLAFGEQELAEPHLRGAAGAVEQVPPERRAQFAAASAAVGLYEGRFGGDPAAALTAAREWLGRGPVLEGHEVAPNLRGLLLTQLGIVEMWTGDLDAAVEHLERAHAVAAEAGVEWTAFASSAHLALASLLRGDLARSLRRANQALAIGRAPWLGAIGTGRPSPTACSPPSASSAISSTRPNASSARRARRCETHASGRSLAVHALNRVQLLSDRGEHVGALDLLHATREQLGDWPLPAPLRRAADRRGRAPGRGDGRARGRPRAATACDRELAGRRQRAGPVGSAGRRGDGGARDARRAPGRPGHARWGVPADTRRGLAPRRAGPGRSGRARGRRAARWSERSTSPSRQACAGCS